MEFSGIRGGKLGRILMLSADLMRIRNGQAVDRKSCPVLPVDRFRKLIITQAQKGARLSAMLVLPGANGENNRLVAVLSRPQEGDLGIFACEVGGSYPSLTPDYPAAHWFEREVYEKWGIEPKGHPWLKPIRFQPGASVPGDVGGSVPGGHPTVGVTDFFQMQGREVHEVSVGPVHAGVIEPGHFRFQCHGETVHHLEISLGYQHRGVERAMVDGPGSRTIHYVETLAGDTTIGHTAAYCSLLEGLGMVRAPARAMAIRAVGAELERLANHIGDLGALAGDIGFLPTMSYCGRIRGDVLNLTAALCGNRFGRGLLVPGGVAYDVDQELIGKILDRLMRIENDSTGAIELLFDNPSVLARFEGTGRITGEFARQVGLVGVAARACGISYDVRADFPYGFYGFSQIPVCTWSTGDCFSRAYVRWLEAKKSFSFIREQLKSLPDGPVCRTVESINPEALVVALVEGWRGEICHVAVTDSAGRFTSYKIVDPSFHNWFGLAWALREQQISDFPLCNKSFNLSYCGHDL